MLSKFLINKLIIIVWVCSIDKDFYGSKKMYFIKI